MRFDTVISRNKVMNDVVHKSFADVCGGFFYFFLSLLDREDEKRDEVKDPQRKSSVTIVRSDKRNIK